MSKFRNFILLNTLLLLMACGTVKDAFVNQKKNKTDEFLVEKKSPLTMPPDFNELPIPKKQEGIANNETENEFKKLITKEDLKIKSEENKKVNKDIEETLLDKIKNN